MPSSEAGENPPPPGEEAVVTFRRGNAEFDEGRYLAAIDSYSQAIRLNPDDVESYINRGNAYTKSGDHDRAIADYDRAIALNEAKGLDRENAIVYFNRGNARFAEGQYDRAIEDYTEAIERNPKDVNAYTNRGIAREKANDRDGARSDLATAARLEAEAQATPSP